MRRLGLDVHIQPVLKIKQQTTTTIANEQDG